MRTLIFVMIVGVGCAGGNDGPGEYANFGTGFQAPVGQESVTGTAPGGADVVVPNGSLDASTEADGGGVSNVDEDTAVVVDPAPDALGGDVEAPQDTVADGIGGEGSSPIGGELGAACGSESPCTDGLVCHVWPNDTGVCTVLGCEGGECPAGSGCTEFTKGTWGCMPECLGSNECREGDVCKPFLLEAGLTKLCHGISDKASGAAGICDVASECKGEAVCLGEYAGGYCAKVGCSPASPCGSGTACIPLEDEGPVCLKLCDASKPCPGAPLEIQSCATADDLDGQPQDVCLEGVVGQEVADFCKVDQDCLSGTCKITSVGLCAESGKPCMSFLDCGGAACEEGPDYIAGTCVQGCDVSASCPEETICVPFDASTGECVKGCYSLSDIVSCGLGAACEYGFQLGYNGGEGTYACKANADGGVGDACSSDEDCTGFCLMGPQGGACASSCGGLGSGGLYVCDWGATCISALGSSQCMKLCPYGDVQCAPGYSCETKITGLPFPLDVCLPE